MEYKISSNYDVHVTEKVYVASTCWLVWYVFDVRLWPSHHKMSEGIFGSASFGRALLKSTVLIGWFQSANPSSRKLMTSIGKIFWWATSPAVMSLLGIRRQSPSSRKLLAGGEIINFASVSVAVNTTASRRPLFDGITLRTRQILIFRGHHIIC